MKTLGSLARRLSAGSAVAIFAACSGPSPTGLTPFAPDAFGRAHTIPAQSSLKQGRSWMSPRAAEIQQLLYISNASNPPAVYVYSYPQAKLVGTLTGFTSPGAQCADKAGDVWITDNNSTIVEYAHGGTSPIATLNDPDYFPYDCAVDPITGNLAVTNNPLSGLGNVAIYKRAQGSPVLYFPDFLPFPFYCGYDNRGNLFVDGEAVYTQFQLAELPIHNSGLFPLSVNQTINQPGGVIWHGKYLAVGDPVANTIYEFAVSGNQGNEVGSTPLDDSNGVEQFWITGSDVIGGDSGAAYYWPYPAGGGPLKAIVGLSNVMGSVVSKLPAK